MMFKNIDIVICFLWLWVVAAVLYAGASRYHMLVSSAVCVGCGRLHVREWWLWREEKLFGVQYWGENGGKRTFGEENLGENGGQTS
jgi:hypothetical protein